MKTNLNIPIGEVVIDANYEKEVSPDFALPSSYVKHQRKIGDEADASIEYVVDREDEVRTPGPPPPTHPSPHSRCTYTLRVMFLHTKRIIIL